MQYVLRESKKRGEKAVTFSCLLADGLVTQSDMETTAATE